MALAAAAPLATKAANVSSADTNSSTRPAFGRHQNFNNLSEADKKALEEKMEANRSAREAQRAVVDKAIEAGDYDAWLAAIGTNNPFAGKINKDNFSKLQELHQLEKQAREIRTSLGIDTPGREGFGRGQGMPGAGLGMNQNSN